MKQKLVNNMKYTKKIQLVRYACPVCHEIKMKAENVFYGNYEFISEKNARNYIKDKNLKDDEKILP